MTGRSFHYLDLTLPTPAENLALDEALLDEAIVSEDEGNPSRAWFRLWESETPIVVLGRASRLHEEVDEGACTRAGVPVIRRCSGGTSVVAGPGCLMYAIVLGYHEYPELRPVEATHQWVMEQLRASLVSLQPDITFQGTCDLTWKGRKFSGNSLRCKRNHVLYHGTVLYNFPLSTLSSYLKRPPREPDYRQGRRHDEFVTNLGHSGMAIRRALESHWPLLHGDWPWPVTATSHLAASKYADPAWNRRL